MQVVEIIEGIENIEGVGETGEIGNILEFEMCLEIRIASLSGVGRPASKGAAPRGRRASVGIQFGKIEQNHRTVPRNPLNSLQVYSLLDIE